MSRSKNCRHCGELYWRPNYFGAMSRSHYCDKPECQRARKRDENRAQRARLRKS